jgi:hypothetical protein
MVNSIPLITAPMRDRDSLTVLVAASTKSKADTALSGSEIVTLCVDWYMNPRSVESLPKLILSFWTRAEASAFVSKVSSPGARVSAAPSVVSSKPEPLILYTAGAPIAALL